MDQKDAIVLITGPEDAVVLTCPGPFQNERTYTNAVRSCQQQVLWLTFEYSVINYPPS